MKSAQLVRGLFLGAVLTLGMVSMTRAADDAPLGSIATQAADDVFGPRKGNWHPSLDVSESWTDNLFNEPTNEQAELITVVSPGLWLAIPARFDQPQSLQTVNTVPGSLAYSVLADTTDYGHYQVFAAYSANFEMYQEFADKNQTTQRAEAKLGYYPGPKTRVELQHVYDNNREAFGSGTASIGQEDLFTGNTTSLSLGYILTERLKLKASGGYYELQYDDVGNNFRERKDWTLTGQVAFAVTAKFDLFTEYRQIRIDYATNDALDSEESFVAAGVEWAVTQKTSGLAKAGYNTKDLQGNMPDDDALQLELQLNYQFSSKTKLTLRGLRQLSETDIAGTTGRLGHQTSAEVSYQLSPKVTSSLNLGWLQDQYRGTITIGTQTAERQDEYLQAGLSLNWNVKNWLSAGCGYDLANRDSNFDSFDYTSNTAYLSVSAAL